MNLLRKGDEDPGPPGSRAPRENEPHGEGGKEAVGGRERRKESSKEEPAFRRRGSRSTAILTVFRSAPKQAFVRVHDLGGSNNSSLRLGRFDYMEGDEVTPKSATLNALKSTRIQQRLIGSFGWSDVGRSFNGFHYNYDSAGGNVTLTGAVPSRGVFQTDGWGFVNVGFGYAAYSKTFSKGRNAGDFRIFGIYHQDWRPIGKTDNRPGPVRGADTGNVRIGTFGAHYIHAAESSAGTLDVLGWGVLQTGRWGVLDHHAGAIAVEAGFQPAILKPLKPWLRGGMFQSTGDDDSNDSEHKAFFQILPTPRIYARMPFFNS